MSVDYDSPAHVRTSYYRLGFDGPYAAECLQCGWTTALMFLIEDSAWNAAERHVSENHLYQSLDIPA